MTDEQALLAAIWDRPHDDLPRLVYADWLDEHADDSGRARAEFIRVQCELAKLDEDDPRWAKLRVAERELWQQFAGRFRRGLQGHLRNEPFHRGFVAPRTRKAACEHLLTRPAEVLSQAPLWDLNVQVRNDDQMTQLAASPRLQRLGGIGIWTMTTGHARTLADSPHAVNVEAVRCRHGVVDRDGIRALAHSANMPYLSRLSMDTHYLHGCLAALVASPLADRLRDLDVSFSDPLDPDVIAQAVAACRRLTRLRFGGTHRGDELMRALARVTTPPTLRRMEAVGCGVTDVGCRALAGWAGAVRLRYLSLSANRITAFGLRGIISSLNLTGLKGLTVTVADPTAVDELRTLRDWLGDGLVITV